MKDIITVIIKSRQGEYSSVSFFNMNDAIMYCIDEICRHGGFDPTVVKEVRSILERQNMIEDTYGGDVYYLEEAKLCKSYAKCSSLL